MEKYNGWTNYETWRVNLEIVDGMTVEDFVGHGVPAPSEVKDAIKEYVESAICESAGGEGDSGRGIARDYALAFVSNVNYWEIAEALIADYAEVQSRTSTAQSTARARAGRAV